MELEAQIKKATDTLGGSAGNILKQRNPPNDQDISPELAHPKRRDIWDKYQIPTKKSATRDGYLHVKVPTINGESQMVAGRLVSRKNMIYRTHQQSKMESWINKTKVMAICAQPQGTNSIHPIDCKDMMPMLKLREQWAKQEPNQSGTDRRG